MPINKIFIPTFISSINYNPARVLPHIYFYNGLKVCEPYFFQGYSNGNTGSVVSNQRTSFPYFDNYEGQDPTSGSRSLLFFNEPAVYGTTPTGSLYTEYWANYINLLYNPRTRLINCEAIIPLADYFKMELNDIVEWRGNYYHLRAINDYNLSNGECKLQLLGPILEDILPNIIPAIACDFEFEVSPCSSSLEFLKVGDEAFGGIVAYLDSCGCNGYVVSTGSLGNYEWGCPSTSSVIPQAFPLPGDYIDATTGWTNTQAILKNCPDRPIAASVASAYTSSGFTNWTLPSFDEFEEIVRNKTAINAGGGNITGSLAWTSNGSGGIISSSATAIAKDLNTINGLTDVVRNTSLPVYAIRYFGSCYDRVTTTTTTCAPTGSTTTTTLAPTTTTTTLAPTTTTTTTALYLYGNCGYGNTVGEACNDAVNNARTLYSDCDAGSFGGGCTVYTDTIGSILTGYTRIFMNGSNWDISSTTGVVSGASSTQC